MEGIYNWNDGQAGEAGVTPSGVKKTVGGLKALDPTEIKLIMNIIISMNLRLKPLILVLP